MSDEKKVVLTEEELNKVAGGGIFDNLPKVDEHDYDTEVKEKVNGGE